MYGVRISYLIIAFIGLIVTYYLGLQVDIMDVDAAQYAYMSMDMMQSGEYLQVQYRDTDYLDKPPLLFWLTSLSFTVFGMHNWSYKLPSLLFSLLAFYSTYRLARLYYSKRIAELSALFLATSQALFMINNDVRTDTLLFGAVAFAMWQLSAYLQTGRWKWLIGGSVGIALAMLAKGPIGLMVPILAFGTDWFAKRQWRYLFKWQWLVALVIIGGILSPMVYGLYLQHGWDGPYFYFWAQSFGRLTGDNPFINSGLGKQDPAPFFFVHTFLWSFLPWSILAVLGLVNRTYAFVKNGLRINRNEEILTVGGFILPFIAVSLSEYKLPHYIFVLFPFAAIHAARYVDDLVSGKTWNLTERLITDFQKLLGLVLLFVAVALGTWSFPSDSVIIWVLFAFVSLIALAGLFEKRFGTAIITTSLFSIIAANLLINGGVYPKILEYQSTSIAGKKMYELGTTRETGLGVAAYGQALNYYAGHTVDVIGDDKRILKMVNSNDIVYTDDHGLRILDRLGYSYHFVDKYMHHNVSLISWQFLNPTLRSEILRNRYLLRIEKQP